MMNNKPPFHRALVRHTVARFMEAEYMNRAENVGLGLLELFGNELQESEGFEVLVEIKVSEEWAKIWRKPGGDFFLVEMSDGGNEYDYEVWA